MDFSPEKKMYQKTLPEKPFDLDQWYPKLSIFTYKSYFLPLTRLEAKVIVD